MIGLLKRLWKKIEDHTVPKYICRGEIWGQKLYKDNPFEPNEFKILDIQDDYILIKRMDMPDTTRSMSMKRFREEYYRICP